MENLTDPFQGLIVFGNARIIPKITFIVAVVNIILFILLVTLLQAVGIALSSVIAECLVTLVSFYYLKRFVLWSGLKA